MTNIQIKRKGEINLEISNHFNLRTPKNFIGNPLYNVFDTLIKFFLLTKKKKEKNNVFDTITQYTIFSFIYLACIKLSFCIIKIHNKLLIF
jgi:hypothetical protein